ncbi:MAG: malto-oligosyltrehalose synthase [Micrococcales bacterium]|nr:malto-oligosyltrehalose synthase [Micrococcales bacterium]MCL2667561.1 malto-oligosyltrehalose synthase [Micrococcales bacterium]
MHTHVDGRRPAPDRPVPVSTYRLQLGPDLRFDDVVARLPYYAALGVTHLYLSPVLRAAPGSTHGYDVIAHDEISDVLGGYDGLVHLSAAAHERGLGLVLDIVPNHMAIPTPAWHNTAFWSVLAEGPSSGYARWFDIDWSAGDGVLVPVLAHRLGTVLARGELHLDLATTASPGAPGQRPATTGGPRSAVLRYGKHVFPVRPGTEDLPLTELLRVQHYRLAYWQVADEELNYRRFFDITTLVALRVEDPVVFSATHDLVCRLVRDGIVDGLRVDHPDGLADPVTYFERLHVATGGAWVVAEKILAGEETLPDDWVCAGTTGYDTAWRVQQTFVDPAGADDLGALAHELAGDRSDSYETLVTEAKRQVVDSGLRTEVRRLTQLAVGICHDDLRLHDHTSRALHDCFAGLLAAMDRYRAYVRPHGATSPESVVVMERAAALARTWLDPDRHETLTTLVDLLLGRCVGTGCLADPRRDELVVRFGQTCAAVEAKGVEDTTFYRWTQLVGLCEVGADPARFAVAPAELLSWAHTQAEAWPLRMTGLSTHDTKRSGDVRARLSVLSELSGGWSRRVRELQHISAPYRSALVDGRIANLTWQTLAATWSDDGPIADARLEAYLTKAMREAKTATTWANPVRAYEDAVLGWARDAVADPAVVSLLTAWHDETRPHVRATTLGQKLVQLTLPGVADTYQGTEDLTITLVDPDNRRPVDTDVLAARLAHLDTGAPPTTLGDEKLLVTSRTLRTRRALADVFTGPGAGITPLARSSDSTLAYARTTPDPSPGVRVVVLATRLSAALDRLGGWSDHTVTLPNTPWYDVFTGTTHPGGPRRVAELLTTLPVALLVHPDDHRPA